MTEAQKAEALKHLKQALETIQAREYKEIAEIPSDNQEYFEVKYSFISHRTEGIFTVSGSVEQNGDGRGGVRLSGDFSEALRHPYSPDLLEQIKNDLKSAEGYLAKSL